MIIEDHNNDQEIDEDEFLQHSSNPKVLKIMDRMIWKDPNSIFLQLAHNGAKLPIDFNVEVLIDSTLMKINDTLVVRRIPTLVENLNIPPIFSKPQNKIQNPKHKKPLYRKPTQIEQEVVVQTYQGSINTIAKNPPM